MSAKRPATNELTHENWDKDEEPEERGTFRLATENEMKNRVIKRAKRKTTHDVDAPNGNSSFKRQSIFGDFTGLTTKTALRSSTTGGTPFSFLSNLSSPMTTQGTTRPTCVSNTNTFSFGGSSKPTNTPFSGAVKNFMGTNTASSISSPEDSKKLNLTSPSPSLFGENITTITQTNFTFGNTSQVSKPTTSLFDNTTKTDETRSLDTSTDLCKTSTLPIINTFSSTLGNPKSMFSSVTEKQSNSIITMREKENKNYKIDKADGDPCKINSSKSDYYGKLKGLNIAVSDWIKMHVDKDPLCVLTPIFKDYEKYLQEIENEKPENSTQKKSIAQEPSTSSFKEVCKASEANSSLTPVDAKTNGSKLCLDTSTETTDKKLFTTPFLFGTNGIFGSTLSTQPSHSNTQFSFSNSKTSINAENDDNNDDDEPPIVKIKQVVEEDAVYSKKCKVFIKKNTDYVDKGVGILYLKPIENSKKTQLLVRADTNLGNILANVILNTQLPVKRMGKNNVLMVCIPTPDTTNPTPMLLRVKTSEEADDLLKTIEMYKN